MNTWGLLGRISVFVFFHVSRFLLLQAGSGSPALWPWKSVKSPNCSAWCHISSWPAAARWHDTDLLWRPHSSSPPPPLLCGSPLLLLASFGGSLVTMSTAVEATGYLLVIVSFIVTGASLVNDQWKISTVSGGVIISYRESENLWHSCAENSAGINECKDFDSLLALPGKSSTTTHSHIVTGWAGLRWSGVSETGLMWKKWVSLAVSKNLEENIQIKPTVKNPNCVIRSWILKIDLKIKD